MCKFKVGDLVRVVDDSGLAGDLHFGDVLGVTRISYDFYTGKYFISTDCGETRWRADRFELLEFEKEGSMEFSKKDLKDGMIVKFRNQERELTQGWYVVLGENLLHKSGYMPLSDYTDVLTHWNGYSSSPDFDIVEVRGVSGATRLDDYGLEQGSYVVWKWENPEEQQKQKLIKEAEEALAQAQKRLEELKGIK